MKRFAQIICLLGLLAAFSPIFLIPGCSSSPERAAITAATVTQNTVEAAYSTWLDKLAERVQPFLVTDRPGHRTPDWTKCPGLYDEATKVNEALKKWKAANGTAVTGWLTIKELTGNSPSPEQISTLRTQFSAEAINLISLLK